MMVMAFVVGTDVNNAFTSYDIMHWSFPQVDTLDLIYKILGIFHMMW